LVVRSGSAILAQTGLAFARVSATTKTGAPPAGDREERLAYFDHAEEYTPYLATAAGGALFLVKTEDKHIGRSLFSKRSRGELAVLGRAVAAIEGLLGPDAIAQRAFVDVGANIGTTAIPAVLAHGFATAVAIEPEPENVRVLRMNVLLNDLEDRVTVLPVAASNAVGTSELVVNRSRGGKHWIATDRSKLRRKDLTEHAVVNVDTVTLDHLADSGVIDADRTGLLWMDAEAHEGHILQGAGSLVTRGTPLVLEWNPVILDRVGDRGKLERAVAESYTHFAGMHRDPDPEHPNFPLQTVDQLPAYAERFLDRSTGLTKTDILVIRLDRDAADGVGDLDQFLRSTGAEDEGRGLLPPGRPGGGLLRRLRSRLRGR
jgi:FkbM family methyltransferase